MWVRPKVMNIALEEVEIPDGRNLDHLCHPAAALAGRQRAEYLRIDPDQTRLIEGSNQVLAPGMIHGRLATHTGVYLREQRAGAPRRLFRRSPR